MNLFRFRFLFGGDEGERRERERKTGERETKKETQGKTKTDGRKRKTNYSRVEGLPGRITLGLAPSGPRKALAEVAPEVVVVGRGAVFFGVVHFFFPGGRKRGSRAAREVEFVRSMGELSHGTLTSCFVQFAEFFCSYLFAGEYLLKLSVL